MRSGHVLPTTSRSRGVELRVYTPAMAAVRPWPEVRDEDRGVIDRMEELLRTNDQSPEELRARVGQLRREAKETDITGYRNAVLALADRYEQIAEVRESASQT